MIDFILNSRRNDARIRYTDKIRDQYDCVSAYSRVIAASSTYSPLVSACDIRIHRDLDFGASQKEVKSCLDRPQHSVDSLNPLTEAIFVYRYRLDEYRIREELHFSSYGLFYVTRTFSSASPSQYETLLHVLSDKYLSGKVFDGIKKKIVDSRGREIMTASSPAVVVEYLAPLDPVLSKLTARVPIAASRCQSQKAAAIRSWL